MESDDAVEPVLEVDPAADAAVVAAVADVAVVEAVDVVSPLCPTPMSESACRIA